MIKVKVKNEDSFIKKITVTGHANYDIYGKDIVCAAVSSIVITSCNMAAKINPNSILLKEKEGFVDVSINVKDKFINMVFQNMMEMLEELSKKYNKNVKII